mmetsp:Transcript_24409/g.30040  ORF Transcript_24409/g.30040 Transcript_24409/m.30040 type:complete len:371 (-) Transcript_24409:202-1314(-)
MKLTLAIFATTLSFKQGTAFTVTNNNHVTKSLYKVGTTKLCSSSTSPEESYLEPLKTQWNDDEIETEIEEENVSTGINDATNSPKDLLQSILITASSSDRGQFASSTQKEQMEEMIQQLEDEQQQQQQVRSTTTVINEPTNSKEIQGTWELLYSSTQLFRSSPFFMAGRAVCQTPEEAERYDWFCDMHRAALAISEIGKVRQIISSDGTKLISEFEVHVGSIPFLSDFLPVVKYSGGLPFMIEGAIVSSADITPVEDGNAWEIFMDTVEIKGSNIPLLRKVLDEGLKLQSRSLGSFLEENVSSYSNPKPIFKTTYLDENIRISRDEDGKVFVYGKVSDVTEPTSYKSVDSDLGLLKLLEGLNDNFFKISI